MGAQQAIRNPPVHERFGDMDDNEAIELLGLASHLMRKLGRAKYASLQQATYDDHVNA